MNRPEPVLVAENVGCQVGTKWLVDHVSFAMRPGFTALIGPNGAGKTTLLRALAGIMPLRSGHVRIAGVPAPGGSARIGYVPQFPGSYEHLTPREFLRRTAWWGGSRNMAEIEDQAAVILDRMHLERAADQPGWKMSAAERRKMALASLWMRQVPVVLLDEPTAGLDPEERLAFWQGLSVLRDMPGSPLGYLVTTHLLSEVQSFCDHVLLLDRGEISVQMAVAEFVSQAAGMTYWSPHLNSADVVDTGRWSAEGFWIVSAGERAPEWQVRPPDLVDAYLWAVRVRASSGKGVE